MPAATANAPNLTGYFKLDGSRNITGPTNIYNGTAASAVLTLRGAASQSGNLLTLQNSTPTTLGAFKPDGRFEATFNMASSALETRYGIYYDVTFTPASASHGGGAGTFYFTVPSGQAASFAEGLHSSVYVAGTAAAGYGANFVYYSASASAQTAASGLNVQATHDGAGLMGSLYGANITTSSSTPVTTHRGLSVSSAVTGTTGTLIGLDVTVSGTATTKYAARFTGGGILADSLTVAADTDATTILGRARFDSRTSDRAYFSHYDMSGSTQYAMWQNASGLTAINAAGGSFIAFLIGDSQKGSISTTGARFGDSQSPATALHGATVDSATTTITNILTLGHNTSGTAAAGYGTGLIFQGESTTTENRDMGRIRTLWQTATDASRAADLVLSAFNVANEREGLRVRGGTAGAELGFFGVTPIARPVLATGAGATVDNVITALQNLGLVSQT